MSGLTYAKHAVIRKNKRGMIMTTQLYLQKKARVLEAIKANPTKSLTLLGRELNIPTSTIFDIKWDILRDWKLALVPKYFDTEEDPLINAKMALRNEVQEARIKLEKVIELMGGME